MDWSGGSRVGFLQTQLFPVCHTLAAKAGFLGSFLSNSLKTNQLEVNTDARTLRPIARLKEPRDLFALPKERDNECAQQLPRWPNECQVLDERVYHIEYAPEQPEPYFKATGKELQPRAVGEDHGIIVYNYMPISAVHYFSRSSVGGSKYLLSAQPYALDPDDLIFESRFESGNLARVVKVTQNYYELYLRPDMYTNRHTQWFYFRVKNTRTKMPYRFSIVNLTKPDSLYKEGMRPLMYSTTDATNSNIGWKRCGENISYYRNDDNNFYNTRNYHQVLDDFDDDDHNNISSYTLTFNVEFQHENDTVYFAHSYPYTYSDLQDYLMAIQRHPVKSKFCKLRLLCRSLAGNNVYYLTVTAPSTPDEEQQKKAVVISARVHPGETPSSWMMKGFMDFITGDSYVAKKLRHKFIFKLVPMLNPDGVIVGNTRSSLTGRDLNRQYRTVIRETYPSIWNTKAMLKTLYCDMHAHSRKHNIFIYGCENLKRHPDRRLLEQVFPLMLHKNVADKFSFENCKFKVQKNKEGTGRIVVWVLGVTNSYTLEASFAGSTMGSRAGTHFSTMDYEHLGRAFCETLMDYYDDNPLKEKLRTKILTRLSKEGSSADEPLNIPLSDYSSDEGSSSSSDDEGKDSVCDLEGPCCQPLRVPPSSPVLMQKKTTSAKKKFTRINAISPKKRNKLLTRSVMDIPTTDPGVEFLEYYTTEDECETDFENDGNMVKTSITRISKILHNDMRKSSSISYDHQLSIMPPELIITKVYDNQFNLTELSTIDNKTTVDMKPPIFTQNIIKEFPPIGKKTKSWHNFNRCMSTVKIRNINCDTDKTYQTAESLHFKLSLKKQIWTGTQSDSTGLDFSRPLSYGAQTSSVLLFNKSIFYDSEALLTACSQKLAAWQENEIVGSTGIEKLKLGSLRASQKSPKKSSKDDNKIVRYKSDNSKNSIGNQDTGFSKVKKKTRTTLNKLVETADIISQLAKNTKSSSAKIKKPILNNNNTVATTIISTINTSKIQKFKTTGIVATAVQTNKKHKKSFQISLSPKSIPEIDTEMSTSDPENLKIHTKKHKHHSLKSFKESTCRKSEKLS
ncbi:unnamed protein product [Diamesa tonsa]